MKKTTAALLIAIIVPLVVLSSGCIGGGKEQVKTTTMQITRTVTETTTLFSTVTTTSTTSTYYITTVYTTVLDTVTVPITTTLVISGTETSTVISNTNGVTTIVTFTADYTYANVPFLVYSIKGNTKIVTIPQDLSPVIAPLISFIHESVENQYTDYTPLANYIGDFDTVRLKILMKNFSTVSTPVNFSQFYFDHLYNPLYGAVYYAAYAMNSHTPVSIILAVKDGEITDAYMGFNNTYYSGTRMMYFNALQYSWYTRLGDYTMVILALDPNGIVTQIETQEITTVPRAFTPFQSLVSLENYGIEVAITSGHITEVISYLAHLRGSSATVWTTIGTYTETTIYTYANGVLTMTTIKPTTISLRTETITITNKYFNPTYYMGVDVLQFFPQNNIDYNARVINGLIMYTIYRAADNTITVYEFTITSTQILNATYYEVAIGDDTVATGTIAGWVN